MGTPWQGTSPRAGYAAAALLALLLLGAIFLGRRLAQRAPMHCLSSITAPFSIADWGTRVTGSFTDLDAAPQPGAVLRGIMVDTGPDTGYSWQGGPLQVGDRLVFAHRDGVRWAEFPPDAGRQEATGWTFVVRRAGAIRIVHLINRASC